MQVESTDDQTRITDQTYQFIIHTSHAKRQDVDISVTVCYRVFCLFVCLYGYGFSAEDKSSGKAAASHFARRLISVQSRESHILGNFARP